MTGVLDPSMLTRCVEALKGGLKASENLLNRKAGVAVFFGLLATTCGILAGTDPTIAATAGVGTIITMTSGAVTKALEEKREIELDDLYFLWKAVEHQPHGISTS
jgi:hypothetical protein